MSLSHSLIWSFLIGYLLVLGVVCGYGLHRYALVHLYHKYRRNTPRQHACFLDLPHVTIQLPMYNEQAVARRLIDATCAIDYPRDRLTIQILDDSTDESLEATRAAAAEWSARGYDIEHIHRRDRTGYKAGALAQGMKSVRGDFVLIFDADFLPPRDIIHKTIHYFTDPNVGMVQARWEHLNRDQSLLTQSQAILLDGHFVVEHGARNRSGRFMSFNGTAGLWRRRCIEDAGGWQHDTLTEDLDLSYRAQMKGWKFIFLPELASPAELPPDMEAFKQQQYRWAKGGAQTCRKLLPRILRSRLPIRIKIEAFFHLTSCVVYPFMLMLTFMLYPVVYLKLHVFEEGWGRYLFDASVLLVATCSAGTFYVTSQRALMRSWSHSLKYLPFLMALGIGISLNNTRAVLTGFFGKAGEFIRTPKFGVTQGKDRSWMIHARARRDALKMNLQPFFECGIGVYLAACLLMCIQDEQLTIGVPFLCLFMAGYLYVAFNTWFGHLIGSDAGEEIAPLLESPTANQTWSPSQAPSAEGQGPDTLSSRSIQTSDPRSTRNTDRVH